MLGWKKWFQVREILEWGIEKFGCIFQTVLTKEFLTKLEWAPMKEINEATGPRISTHLCLKAEVQPLVFQHWDSLIVYYFTFGLDSWGAS